MSLIADLDLFDTFRWLLAIICTVYAVIVMWHWFWGYAQWFSSSNQMQRVGRYAMLLVLRIRIRRFVIETLQILALAAAFFVIVHLHRVWVPRR
jgi:hypothetical protein